MKKKIFYGCLALLLAFSMAVLSVSVQAELLDGNQSGCTAIAVGKAASTDGSAIITHNDDSSVADFRLWMGALPVSQELFTTRRSSPSTF